MCFLEFLSFQLFEVKKLDKPFSKTVYKKVEDAFPLSINGYEAKISSKLKLELLEDVDLSGNFKTKV